MADEFDGRTVVVTGAAGGIGRELCRLFVAEGATVVAIDRDSDGLQALGGSASVTASVDLTKRREVAEAVARPVDVLINNAGVTSLGPFTDTPPDAFEEVMAVNVLGTAAITRALLPGLIDRRGRIGVLSSVAGFAPLLHRTAYSASKHALHGLFESLRVELASHGVSVTMICPAFVDTGIETRAVARAPGEAGNWSTTGRHLTPARVATDIVEGLRRRRRLVLPGATAKLAYAMWRLAPTRYERIMQQRIG